MATERCGRDVWEPRVRAYRNSGMTQKQWCAENDTKVRALAYWIKNYGMKEWHSILCIKPFTLSL